METKEKFWTPEKITEFKNRMKIEIIRYENYIRHCITLIIVSVIACLYILLSSGFTVFSLTSASVFFISAFICWCYYNKFKTKLVFCRVSLHMPDEAY